MRQSNTGRERILLGRMHEFASGAHKKEEVPVHVTIRVRHGHDGALASPILESRVIS